MEFEEIQLKIFAALLARDPLSPQRFQEINTRLALLAELSCAAAHLFVPISQRWREDPDGSANEAGLSWDAFSHREVKNLKNPEPVPGAEDVVQADLLDEVERHITDSDKRIKAREKARDNAGRKP